MGRRLYGFTTTQNRPEYVCGEEEKEIGIWLNTIDPYHRSKYKTTYDIKTTPQIYLLDKDKIIVSKRLSAEQIPDILDELLLTNEELPEKHSYN